MKRINKQLWIVLAAVFLITCETENNVKPGFPDFFIKYYGDTGDQQGVDLLVNADGTILLLGNSFDEEKENRIFLTKVSEQGQVIWQQFYGVSKQDFAVDIEPLSNGNFIILGYRNVDNDADPELIEIDPNGVVVPGKEIVNGNLGENDFPRSVTPISDGGLLVIGQTTAVQTNSSGEIILDALPNIFIQRYQNDYSFVANYAQIPFGSGGVEDGIKIVEPSPNVFQMFFSTNGGNISDNFNFVASELDNDGNPQGLLPLLDGAGNVTDEQLRAVAYSASVGYALLGSTSPEGSNTPKSINLITLGPGLDLSENQPQITYTNRGKERITPLGLQGDMAGVAVAITADNGYLVLANQSIVTSGSTNNNLALLRLNLAGNVMWETSFGAEYSDFGGSVTELPNGKILIFGTVTLGNQEKMVLIKVNSKGQFAP